MYELIIVGGGPAGMTAAVYAARKRIETLLLSKDIGGQVVWTMGIENYMGYQFIEGSELMQKFEEQVRQFPLEMKIGPGATHIRKIDGGFEVEANDGATYQAKALIVATGKRPRPLNVPGEERLRGRGVTYCSICDGPIFAGQRVAVIGGGNSALGAAEEMVKIAEHVDLVSITPLTGDQVLIDKISPAPNLSLFLEYEVLEIVGRDRVEGITIRDLQSKETHELAVGGIFVEIGLIPNSDLARDVVNRNRAGEIEVNYGNETNVAGLFAAGDVTNVPEKQIVIAAGEGAKASLAAHRYLQRI
ncbi:MAG: NADH dehydrogenase [Dehalococcoidia bacterium]|nr:NADH dehydrogenase [Chloroflexota bacterium]MBT9161525.1 NADH dehydrogenase [Chloroflexota bacterium]